ncbi:signal peptidase I [Hydrogenoanaerobacterium saccharovorans]|uniref:Signal peptidase I n=1 Tax=Hydrogenoanaerobacterium saccharovorans TaxID=474960 RepID=A0A1H8CJV0_9FIRM|nr:signal peptidase I [Hydrogenoanaerobacterium saccharovorans]RPF43162.1 signal peptidase I [Hydrogenoanaerobacterium saccharovorans]SEM95290.1 signal peptidase I [Hydrogenoanaerobacterium saccharovorans]
MDTFKRVLKEWVIPFALEILVIVLIVKFICFFAVVPTGSMIPTVDEHSWLFATRMYNPEKNVKRGDILVFRSDEMDQTLLKRCIGLPGEEITLDEEGKLYINGEYYEEPYVVNKLAEPAKFRIPQGHYLFLGDNRSGSLDARYWDEPYISADKIMGKARFTIWPFKNFGPLK